MIKSVLESKKYCSISALLGILTDHYGLSELVSCLVISQLESKACTQSTTEFESNVAELLRTRPSLTIENLLDLVVSDNEPAHTVIDRLKKMKLSSASEKSTPKNVELFGTYKQHRLLKAKVL